MDSVLVQIEEQKDFKKRSGFRKEAAPNYLQICDRFVSKKRNTYFVTRL